MATHALITGGAGFIGAHIAQYLIDQRHVDKVVLLDHFGRYTDSVRAGFTDYRSYRLNPIQDRVIVERGEPKFSALLLRLLHRYQPRFVFHLAALPLAKPNNLNVEEAREGSVDATGALLETINEISQINGYKPDRFVYASSSMVYGDFVTDPATEEHPTNPKEIYGTMKLAGEIVTRGQYSLCYRTAVRGLRPNRHEPPRQPDLHRKSAAR